VRCDCDHEALGAPGTRVLSLIESRKRDLLLSEHCLVGPLLATFVAALAVRMRMPREGPADPARLAWAGAEQSHGQPSQAAGR
jgi:hypothetical protein